MEMEKRQKIILDIHSHVLPKMDDGSRSCSESLDMLRVSAAQKISYMVATPHFYADENDPEQFLRRRDASVGRLRENWQPGLPKLLLGAEVHYFEGISRTAEIASLKIQGTQLLLLEMPFCLWTDRMLSEVLELEQRRGTIVLLAHIERYLRWQPPEVWNELLESGVLAQCNAEFLLHWRTRCKALNMLNKGKIHFLGSDCHNMNTRPPRLGEVIKRINQSELERLEQNIQRHFPFLEGVNL